MKWVCAVSVVGIFYLVDWEWPRLALGVMTNWVLIEMGYNGGVYVENDVVIIDIDNARFSIDPLCLSIETIACIDVLLWRRDLAFRRNLIRVLVGTCAVTGLNVARISFSIMLNLVGYSWPIAHGILLASFVLVSLGSTCVFTWHERTAATHT